MPKLSPTTLQVGNEAELLACNYLQQHGLKLICKNYRTKQGELDLIMEDDRMLVFIEVRLRHNPLYGSGAETVTRSKQDKLIKAALYYLQQNPTYASWPNRFDVVSIASMTQHPDIEWIKNAFMAEG